MTAPREGSPIGGMIQTIIALRRLQLEESAQQLQQQQIGISQQNLKLNQNAQPVNLLGQFQGVLGHSQHPSAFLPYASQFAQQFNMPEQAVTDLINQTPADASTTRSAAVASGAAQAGGSLDRPAATQALTGGSESELMKDSLLSKVFGQTGDYYSTLTPDQRKGFLQGVLQRQTTGETVGEAALGQATADFMGRAPQPVKDQIVSIGKGLAPSASEDAQLRLGWANYRLKERETETSLALEDLKTRAALTNAQHSMDAQAFKEVNDLLDHRSTLMQNMARTASTQNEEGVRAYAQQLNAFNEQIRQAVPQVYGSGVPEIDPTTHQVKMNPDGSVVWRIPPGTHPLNDLPLDKTLSVSTLMGYLQGRMNQP